MLQGATRNPLADPSIPGINAGAALFVVIGVALFGVSQLGSYVWLAFAGAGTAMVVVYAVASLGREGPTPIKLALAGAAVMAALQSGASAILLTSPRTLDEVRFWQVGALAGRGMDIVLQVAPFIAVGSVLALALTILLVSSLSALQLGDDTAKALGSHVELVRFGLILVAVAYVAFATAAVGPVSFVAFVAGPIARGLLGGSGKGILQAALVGAIVLLGSDLVAQHALHNVQLPVGVVTGVFGAAFLVWLLTTSNRAGQVT